MKKHSVLILTLLLTACNTHPIKTVSTLQETVLAKRAIKTELIETDKRYLKANKIYHDNKRFFSKEENRLMQRGFKRIHLVRRDIYELYEKKGINKAVAYARFLQSWGNAREGYALIHGVLQNKQGISDEYAEFIKKTHLQVIQVERLVDKLTPKDGVDYGAMMGLIDATATLVDTLLNKKNKTEK